MKFSRTSRFDWREFRAAVILLDRTSSLAELEKHLPGVADELKKRKIAGKPGSELVCRLLNPSRWLMFIGVKDAADGHEARKLAKRIVSRLQEQEISETMIHSGFLTGIQAPFLLNLIDFLALNGYRFDRYKKGNGKRIHRIVMVGRGRSPMPSPEWKRMAIVQDSVTWVRDLVNEIPGRVTPDGLISALEALQAPSGLSVETWRRGELEKRNLAGILSVGASGCCDPALVRLDYTPPRFKYSVALVGKGITFDSGGLNIKTGSSMEEMKSDMAGAALVGGILRTAWKLRLPIRLVGFAAVAENMPGPRAYKPGDIIRYANGKTVEVVNTDAEGRLILADALIEAVRHKPDMIVEFSTLTGAMVVALGDAFAGLMCTQSRLASRLLEAGRETGEFLWELPLFEEYRESIKSKIADLKNANYQGASSIKAGLFLREFSGRVPFAHIDIAGTAFLSKSNHYHATEGATGFGLRLMIRMLSKLAEESRVN